MLMKRYFFSFVTILLSVSMLFMGCKKNKNAETEDAAASTSLAAAPVKLSSLADYTKCVPADAVCVFKLNAGAMLDKSDLLTDATIRKQIDEVLNEADDDQIRAFIQKLCKDVDASGIDLHKHAIVAITDLKVEHNTYYSEYSDYYYDYDEPIFKVIVAMAIKSEENLKKTIELLGNEAPIYFDNYDGVNQIYADEQAIAAFDAHSLVIAFDAATEEFIDPTEYFSLAKSRQACQKKEFKDFFYSGEDMAAAISYGEFVDFISEYDDDDLQELLPILNKLHNAFMTMTLNMGNGDATMRCLIDGVPADLQKANLKPTNQYLSYVPASAAAVLNVAVSNEGFDASLKNLTRQQRESVEEVLSQLGFSLESFKAINGDVMLAAYPAADGKEMPEFMAMVQCANAELYDALCELLKNANMPVDYLNDGKVCVLDTKDEFGSDYYFGYLDGTLFVMSETMYGQTVKNAHLKALSSSFASSSYTKALKNFGGAVIVADPCIQIGENMKAFSGRNGRRMLKYLKMIDQFAIFTENETTGCAAFILKADYRKENILKTIKDIIIKEAL